ELDDPAKGIRNLPYMSEDFLEMLRFTGEKAKEIGLRMDLTLGSGWPFGGPHITAALASPRLRVESDNGPAAPLKEGETLVATVEGKRFILSQTRQTVKRPAVNAEGWV